MKKLRILLTSVTLCMCLLLSGVLTQGVQAKDHQSKLDEIIARGYLLVGSTGDYKPMSYLNKDTGKYEGFDVALADNLAKSLGVEVRFVATSWPNLMKDTLAGKFDVAMCGISRTTYRAQKAALSHGYVVNGKTVLMRAEDAKKYTDLDSINRPEVRVMVNPGGSNEKFAHANLSKATLIVHNFNAEIPGLIAEGKADIMVTENIEALKYTREDARLAAPLINNLFTKSEFGIMLQRGDQEFLNYINFWMEDLKLTGQMQDLENQYIWKK